MCKINRKNLLHTIQKSFEKDAKNSLVASQTINILQMIIKLPNKKTVIPILDKKNTYE